MEDKQAERRFRDVLDALGGDLKRYPNLEEAPRLFTSLLGTFLEEREAPELSCMAVEGESDVIIHGLRFHSLCEHHLVPFFGTFDLAYRPAGRVAGFGGIERTVAHFSRRPQIQERLTHEVAARLFDQLEPKGLVLRSQARQMCLEMQGGTAGAIIEVVVEQGGDAGSLRQSVLRNLRTL